MAHAYTVTRMESPYNAVGDYFWTIYGTVDGVAVVVNNVYDSLLRPKFANAVQFQSFVSPLLLDAFNRLPQNTPTQAPPVSSWSQ